MWPARFNSSSPSTSVGFGQLEDQGAPRPALSTLDLGQVGTRDTAEPVHIPQAERSSQTPEQRSEVLIASQLPAFGDVPVVVMLDHDALPLLSYPRANLCTRPICYNCSYVVAK